MHIKSTPCPRFNMLYPYTFTVPNLSLLRCIGYGMHWYLTLILISTRLFFWKVYKIVKKNPFLKYNPLVLQVVRCNLTVLGKIIKKLIHLLQYVSMSTSETAIYCRCLPTYRTALSWSNAPLYNSLLAKIGLFGDINMDFWVLNGPFNSHYSIDSKAAPRVAWPKLPNRRAWAWPPDGIGCTSLDFITFISSPIHIGLKDEILEHNFGPFCASKRAF